MTKYETLKIEIVELDSSDIIATSAEVTTGQITIPWNNSSVSTSAFQLLTVNEEPCEISAFKLDL